MIGRPLRFLMLTTGGWVVVRVAMLWPTIDSVPALVRAIAPPVTAATPMAFYAEAPRPRRPSRSPSPSSSGQRTCPALQPISSPPGAKPAAAGAAPHTQGPAAPTDNMPIQPPPLSLPGLDSAPRSSRLGASLWAVARSGTGESRPGGQLGGSQGGIRVTYRLDDARRLALAGRLSSPLNGKGREAAIGFDWQPFRVPVHLIVEQRINLDGGRGGPAALVVAGLDPRPVAPGITAEAYGQAGAVVRGKAEGFADGALRLTHAVAAHGALRLDLGLGGWAGVQRGAARVDLGPTVGLRVPVAGRAIRIALDWRQRVAGHARPGSGPVLTIGSDL